VAKALIGVEVLRGVGVELTVGVMVLEGVWVGVKLGVAVEVDFSPAGPGRFSRAEQACKRSKTIRAKTSLRIITSIGVSSIITSWKIIE